MYRYPPGSFISRKGRKQNAIGNYNGTNHTDEWIDKMIEYRPEKVRHEWFRALNSGMYCGYAKDILKMLKFFKITNLKEDDQALWSNAMISFPEKITIDFNNRLFSNAHTWDGKSGCFFKYNERSKMWTNTETKTVPFFIQTPGSIQNNYSCYKKLTSKYNNVVRRSSSKGKRAKV
jgi:hypothetical protein